MGSLVPCREWAQVAGLRKAGSFGSRGLHSTAIELLKPLTGNSGAQLRAHLTLLVHVLDGRLVHEHPAAAAHFQRVAVVPFDATLNGSPSSRTMTMGVCDWICFWR